MDIEHLLKRLEAVILEGRKVPGTEYRVVDAKRCFSLIDQMVLSIPEEVKRSRSLEAERDHILENARREAARTREIAEEEVMRMTEQHNIVLVAQNRARNLEERARQEADRLKLDADTYSIDALRRLSNELEQLLALANNGVADLERDRTAIKQRLQSYGDDADGGEASDP
ncbi:MAG: hypothetical protein KIH69_013165 [Anaerolineae bacterium]|nr:hypothetical protein [Anaerolineae bacterium]